MKNYITIFISASAFALSILATVTSLREANRGLRVQFTDVLAKISATTIDRVKVLNDQSLASSRSALTDALDEQQDFLLEQAKYLIDQNPGLVTSVELSKVASLFYYRGDLFNAEVLYRRAIDLAPSGHYSLKARVAYGFFLFSQRRYEAAEKAFEEALSSVRAPASDQDYHIRGWAYQEWGLQEQNVAPLKAQKCLENARKEYEKIGDPQWRQNALNDLDKVRTPPSPAASATE